MKQQQKKRKTVWGLLILNPHTRLWDSCSFTSLRKLKDSWSWRLRGSAHWIIVRNGKPVSRHPYARWPGEPKEL